MMNILVQDNEREVIRNIMSQFSDDINSIWIENCMNGRTLFIQLNAIRNIDNILRVAENSINENNACLIIALVR